MTFFLFSNQAQTALALPVAPTDTTITVASGTSSYFPNPTTGQIFTATLVSAQNNLINEICYVTNVTGDVWTVERAQEGTVARSWSIGDYVVNLLTAGTMEAFSQVSGWSGQSGYSGYSGFSGQSGLGFSGYSGQSGYSGFSGQSG